MPPDGENNNYKAHKDQWLDHHTVDADREFYAQAYENWSEKNYDEV